MSRVRVPSFAHFFYPPTHENRLNYIQALILGIVQGITEFFPVSSSAHLRIFKKFLSIPDGEHLLYFDLLCHAGTLCALILYLRREIWQVLKDFRQMALFFLALLPLVPAYFLLKPLRIALSDPSYTGFFLIITAILLFQASKTSKPSPALPMGESRTHPFEAIANQRRQKWKDVLWIGLAQSVALIPGISRSGSTIAMASLLGWKLAEGAKFSFLLAVPTILGGEFLETMKLLKNPSQTWVSMPCYAIGFFASFVVGLFSVRTVFWIYGKGHIRPFAWYCLGIGLLTMALFYG